MLAPRKSDLHTWAPGYCKSSSDCEFPGCNLDCTGTRNSRMTSHHSPCGLRSSPDEALHLLGTQSRDNTNNANHDITTCAVFHACTIVSLSQRQNNISSERMKAGDTWPGFLASLCTFVLRSKKRTESQ